MALDAHVVATANPARAPYGKFWTLSATAAGAPAAGFCTAAPAGTKAPAARADKVSGSSRSEPCMLRASRLAQPGTPMLERDVLRLAPTRKQLTRQARQ
jgi:hypothetical protein